MQIIKSQHEENAKLLLVDIAWEELNISDTYDNYGQRVSSSDAGDHIAIGKTFEEKFVNDDDEEVELKEGDVISAYDNSELFDWIWEKTKGKDNEYFEFHYQTVTGFNYWDGNNHKTIVIADSYNDPTHEVLEGEEYDQMIAEYETAEKIKEGFGTETLLSKNFVYTVSNFSGAFEVATVETIEDFEARIDTEIENYK